MPGHLYTNEKKFWNMSNKSTFVVVIHRIIVILLCLESILFCGFTTVAIAPWYISQDAKIARENLQILSQAMADRGYIDSAIDVSGIKGIFIAPYDKSAQMIYEMSVNWSEAYAALIQANGGVDPDDTKNPYSTFATLDLTAENEYIQSVYDSLAFNMEFYGAKYDDAGSRKIKVPVEREVKYQSAEMAINIMHTQYKSCVVVYAVGAVTAIILIILAAITGKLSDKQED